MTNVSSGVAFFTTPLDTFVNFAFSYVDRKFGKIPDMENPLWYKNAVFYEIYVRAFADGNGDGIGDLIGLTERLDYIQQIGVDCLWLMPIYLSPLEDDGYDISDYYKIHPDYGNLDDFIKFLKEAHRRGIRVIMDLVLNHTSDQHPWFQEARSNPHSKYHDYYVWSDSPEKYSQARIIFLDTESSNWTWDEKAGKYFWHRFFSSQPDLNYDNPAVQEEMLNVMRYWFEMGIDGFRADAVPYLYEREDTNCENLPETHAYLKRLRQFLDENFPGRILLCEANQWPVDVRPYFGDGDEFQMGFHFPVMPRIYMSLARADRTPIADILAATPPIPPNCQWCTFLRNHDELTLEMVTPEERDFMWRTYAPEPRMRLNLGIRRRLAPLMDNDQRKIELLNSILFSLPGTPIIYYGDEIGMGDNIWLKDRDGVRTPMQWNAGVNAGFSAAPPSRLYEPVISDEVFGYQKVNVQAQREDPGSLWHKLRHMIEIRKQHPAFQCGIYEILPLENHSVLVIVRSCPEETIITVQNLSDQRQSIHLSVMRWRDFGLMELLSNQNASQITEAGYPLELAPYQYLWLQLLPPGASVVGQA